MPQAARSTRGLKSDCFQSQGYLEPRWSSGIQGRPAPCCACPAGWAYENGANWLTYASQVDIDCAEKNGFDETDKKYLEELAALLGRACDW